jgi:RNA polymerase sigma-70 factor (ECF subfamily)
LVTRKEQTYYELLILRCRRKDRSAQEELIRCWEKRLFYYIRRLLDDEEDAWDVLQETWLAVLSGVGSIKEPASLPTWLYRIARNKAMNRLRRKCAERHLSADEEDLSAIGTDDESVSLENAEYVHQALGRLSLPHREVLTLFFLEDLSLEEIAEVLQSAVGTIKSRLHYAKRALRLVLEEEAYVQ